MPLVVSFARMIAGTHAVNHVSDGASNKLKCPPVSARRERVSTLAVGLASVRVPVACRTRSTSCCVMGYPAIDNE